MRQMNRIARGLLPLCCALCLGATTTALAGDEDMMSPYQKFDPETGFFVDDPSRKRQHEPQDQKQAQDQKQDTTVAGTSSTSGDSASGGSPAAPASGSATGNTPTLVIASVLMLGLLAGAVLWLRRSPQKTP